MQIGTIASLFLALSAGTAIAEVTVTTDKPEYEVGEIVHIEAYNSGPGDELILSTPWFAIANEDTQQCVVGCLGLPDVTPFPAGQKLSMSWDTGSHPDEPGRHVVHLNTSSGPSTSYVLGAGVPQAARTWGTLKARYR